MHVGRMISNTKKVLNAMSKVKTPPKYQYPFVILHLFMDIFFMLIYWINRQTTGIQRRTQCAPIHIHTHKHTLTQIKILSASISDVSYKTVGTLHIVRLSFSLCHYEILLSTPKIREHGAHKSNQLQQQEQPLTEHIEILNLFLHIQCNI